MDIFDETIREIREWFRQKEHEGKARQYHVADIPRGPSTAGSSNSTIILREDTHVELGHPSVGSCSATLATGDTSLVTPGRVTLVGPDIHETGEKMLPFAQIALAACREDIEGTSSAMDRLVQMPGLMDGYMLRSVPNRIWARVSKEAARSGFSMPKLGRRLMDLLRDECSNVTAAEICFVTGTREEVSELAGIVDPAREKLLKLQTYERMPDGTYECTAALDCTECPEKPVCDNIREVITIRKGDRIITFRRDDKNET